MSHKLFDVNLSDDETEYLNQVIKDNEFKCSDFKRIGNLLRHLRLKNSFGRINRSLNEANKYLKEV